MVMHFFNDITHFDGKFFTTVKDVIVRPGFLSREYVAGKRASYLNPVRMYIFTSAFFFFIVFSFFKPANEVHLADINGKTIEQVNRMDSTTFAEFTSHINKEDGKDSVPMTRHEGRNASPTWSGL